MREEFTKRHYTDNQVAKALENLEKMDHETMARMWRFGAMDAQTAIYFRSDLPVAEAFKNRLFKHFGGITSEISKRLDWQ